MVLSPVISGNRQMPCRRRHRCGNERVRCIPAAVALVPAHNSGGLELLCTAGWLVNTTLPLRIWLSDHSCTWASWRWPNKAASPADTIPGSQSRQQGRRGCCASRRQDGGGRKRGRKCANLPPVVAQADLDAGQLRDVAADGSRAGGCNFLLRQEAYASASIPPNSLTAASNFASLCSAPMISRNSLISGIP
jgi:hypothetical protein